MAKANGKLPAGQVWVVRSDGQYTVHEREPMNWSDVSWGEGKQILACDDYSDVEFCSFAFERLTGIKLEEGQYTKMKMTAIGGVWEPIVERKEGEDGVH